MGVRLASIATLLLAGWLAITSASSTALADEGRSVGYVLSFRLGIDEKPAQQLINELATSSGEWLRNPVKRGGQVAKGCAKEPACIRHAAMELGVSRIGFVTIVAAGGVVRIDVRLMDPNTGSELQRTNAEYETSEDGSSAKRAIYDLIPRLLPGEKVAPAVVVAPTITTPPPATTVPKLPAVTDIPPEPIERQTILGPVSPKKEQGRRWWLWGGLGAATTVGVVATLLILSSDDGSTVPMLNLPPPQ